MDRNIVKVMDRNIVEVIEKLQTVVPDTETILLHDLEKIHRDCGFTAPELMGRRWMQLQIAMVNAGIDVIPPWELNDWQRKFCKIMTNCEDMADEDWIEAIRKPRIKSGPDKGQVRR